MRKSVIVAALGLGLAAFALPKPAHAACSTGAFNICAAVTASTYSVTAPQQVCTGQGKNRVCTTVNVTTNHLVLFVYNLGGPGGQGQSHVILAAGANVSGVTNGTLVGAWYTSGGVGTGTNVGSGGTGEWNNSNAQGPVGVRASISDVLGNTGSGGLIGCNESPHDNGIYNTCYPLGSALVLDFSTGSEVPNLNQAFLFGWHSGTVAGQVGCSLWVSSDGTTVGDQNAVCNVVPEPVTMVLLGSGLAGMGGVGLFRRRKHNGDVANG